MYITAGIVMLLSSGYVQHIDSCYYEQHAARVMSVMISAALARCCVSFHVNMKCDYFISAA